MIKRIVTLLLYIGILVVAFSASAEKYFILGAGNSEYGNKDDVWYWASWDNQQSLSSEVNKIGIGGKGKKWGWEATYVTLGKATISGFWADDHDSRTCIPYETCSELIAGTGFGEVKGLDLSVLRYFKLFQKSQFYLKGGAFFYQGYWREYTTAIYTDHDSSRYPVNGFYSEEERNKEKSGVTLSYGYGFTYGIFSLEYSKYDIFNKGIEGLKNAKTITFNVRIPF